MRWKYHIHGGGQNTRHGRGYLWRSSWHGIFRGIKVQCTLLVCCSFTIQVFVGCLNLLFIDHRYLKKWSHRRKWISLCLHFGIVPYEGLSSHILSHILAINVKTLVSFRSEKKIINRDFALNQNFAGPKFGIFTCLMNRRSNWCNMPIHIWMINIYAMRLYLSNHFFLKFIFFKSIHKGYKFNFRAYI